MPDASCRVECATSTAEKFDTRDGTTMVRFMVVWRELERRFDEDCLVSAASRKGKESPSGWAGDRAVRERDRLFSERLLNDGIAGVFEDEMEMRMK